MNRMFISRLRNIWDKSSFYVILILCAATIGLTAYFTGREDSSPLPTIPPIAATNAPTKTPAISSSGSGDSLPVSGDAVKPAQVTIAALPVQGEVVIHFSLTEPIYNKTLGHYAVHPAVDIAAHESMPVHACADGTVTRAYEDAMLGSVIEVDHGEFTAIYGSLSTLSLVRVGDPVSLNQTISFAGTCKGEQHLGAHVHFAVLIGGEFADPLELLE